MPQSSSAGRHAHDRVLFITWGLTADLGGLSGKLAERAGAFARATGETIKVLTLDASTAPDEVATVLNRNEATRELQVQNIWSSLGEAADACLSELASVSRPEPVLREFLLPHEGAGQTVRKNSSGKVLQVDRFRQDGTRWCSDRRDAGHRGTPGGRQITLFSREGEQLGQWNSPSSFYFAWLDLIIGEEPTSLISDSQFVGSFLHKYQRDHVTVAQVLHGIPHDLISQAGEELSSSQRKILKHAQKFDVLAVTDPDAAEALLHHGSHTGNLALLPSFPVAEKDEREAVDLWRKALRGFTGAEEIRASRFSSLSEAEKTRELLSEPIQEDLIHWESTHGSGALCNPEALFREMLADSRYAGFRHSWVLSANAQKSGFAQEFADDPRVQYVERKSDDYWRSAYTAKYLINNTTFPFTFSKRPEQIYVNTWHGTPLKKMGYDVENGAQAEQNACRNFAIADYLIAQNTHMADYMYLEAHRLKHFYPGAIIEEGYPRSDHMFGRGAGDELRTAMRRRGVHLEGKKVALFAPTWRGTSSERPKADTDMFYAGVEAMREALDPEEWAVLFKAHKVNYSQFARDPRFREILVPHEIQANHVLGGTDLMVADYSSIYIDFLATGKPIAFYLPDLEEYKAQRGLYVEADEFPGPISSTPEELTAQLAELAGDRGAGAFPEAAERYAALAQKYTPKDDGDSSRRILDIVFGGKEEGYAVRRGHTSPKPSLLIHAGDFGDTPVTEALLKLIDSLDRDRYEITVTYERTTSEERKARIRALPHDVRQVIRSFGVLRPELRKSLRSLRDLDQQPLSRADIRAVDPDIWQAEWQRLFGEATFDVILDFSGDTLFWSRFLLEGQARERILWSHEVTREAAKGSRKKREALRDVTRMRSAYHRTVVVPEGASTDDIVTQAKREIWYSAAPAGRITRRAVQAMKRLRRRARNKSTAGELPQNIR